SRSGGHPSCSTGHRKETPHRGLTQGERSPRRPRRALRAAARRGASRHAEKNKKPEASRPATPADLATLLRRVHALPTPSFALPRRELLGGVERWLRLAGDAIDPADADFLRARRDGFAPAAAALTPHLTPGPVHGDALPRNVLAGPDGPVLSDLETFSFDLREHDLVVMDLSRDRYGLPTEAYEDFVRAYGWDVREWEGRLTLRGARETASCAWVAQHAPSNPAALTEFRRRVDSLRDGDTTVRWYPF
ncbi:LOW QUALITY PROTEIN: aminoglycoside phosphotransferase, partial [Streptomyces sp. SPB78]